LQSYAATEFPVSELEVTEAQNKLQAARDELETIEHETQAKRGALQQVGGDVYKQGPRKQKLSYKQPSSGNASQILTSTPGNCFAKRFERQSRKRAVTWGPLLSGPIASRFSQLTGGRYSKLALGPGLESQGIFAAGDDRDISLLSVGAKDQLSTVLRLTIAEQLKSTGSIESNR